MSPAKPRYKTIFVNPPMAPIRKAKKIKVEIGQEQKTGMFGGTKTVPVYEERTEWVETGELAETHVDMATFQALIDKAMNSLAAEGYRVISVMPIEGGTYKYGQYDKANNLEGLGGGPIPPATCFSYGFSFTTGAMVSGELIE